MSSTCKLGYLVYPFWFLPSRKGTAYNKLDQDGHKYILSSPYHKDDDWEKHGEIGRADLYLSVRHDERVLIWSRVNLDAREKLKKCPLAVM